MIAVVDYDAGNLTSIESALEHLDAKYTITANPEIILNSAKVIFPGVGEARHAMGVLKERELDKALIEFADSGKPLLGICLGAQILHEFSEEGETNLLGIIPGQVKRFPRGKEKVPQIGWNTLIHNESALFRDIRQNSSFYFVHSYCIAMNFEDGSLSPWTAGESEYVISFASAVCKGNVWGTQFHPEKSGFIGLRLMKNFIELAG